MSSGGGARSDLRFSRVIRRLLPGSLLIVPAAVAARLAGAPDALVFALATAALVPLAWLISRATEDAGRHTGPLVGGLLNATFGNTTELMVAFFAIADGLFEVVRGSLTGSVVSNLLLVLGLSLLVAGDSELDRRSTREALGLLALAVPALGVLGLPYFLRSDEAKAYGAVTFPVSIALVVVYVAVIALALRRKREARDDDPGTPEWSLRRALAVLGLGVLAAAAMSEMVTGTIEAAANTLHVSQFFVAAVIVAIVGNAAEHASAVVVVAHGQTKLGADVALESAAQVAAFVIPAVAMASWLVAPLPLPFSAVELSVLAGATALAALLVFDGRSTRRRGGILVGAYVAAVLAFLLG